VSNDAGQAPNQLSGSKTGFFVGIGQNDYAKLILNSQDLGSDKYVVIRYSLAQNIVVMMNKIPNSTNMVF